MQEATRSPQADASAQAFIQRWQGVTASELSTAQSFVRELCDLLGGARAMAGAARLDKGPVARP